MFLVLLLVDLVSSAPLLLPQSVDVTTSHLWPLWTAGPYLYHPSIRWISHPPLVYFYPVPSLPSTEPSNRLFPIYKSPSKNQKVVFEPDSDIGLRVHASEPEHRTLEFYAENSTDVNTTEVDVDGSSTETSNVTLNSRTKRDVIFPESETKSKTLSATGKLVFDGLSMLGSALAATAYSTPSHSEHLLHPAALGPPPPGPLFHPFVFPGPSALYPQLFPLGVGNQGFFPSMPSPYQALSVDSLLVPLVGMVGLNLLVPDIAKTKRQGRPSDLNGIDVFRRLMEDEQCLKKLSCEAGVVLNPNDDPQTIKRALQVGLTARRKIPQYHYDTSLNHGNCAVHHCELNFDSLARSSSTISSSLNSTTYEDI